MPAPTTGAIELTEHGIQLNYVAVRELRFESDRLPAAIPQSEYGESSITTGRSDYNEKDKTIQVKVVFDMPAAKEFKLRVDLVAQFRVDEAIFPKEKVHLWAEKGAYYVLFPFLREQVYALSIRVGLQPLMTPTFLLPTFKVELPRADASDATRLELAHS